MIHGLAALRAALALLSLGAIAAGVRAAETPANDGGGIPVLVAQAVQACFSRSVLVTGYLVPRTDAIVTFETEGYQIAEVLAHEGEQVPSGQPLARLTRIGDAPQGPQAGLAAAMPATILLRAPAAGRILSAAATPGSTASPKGDPLFHLAVDNLLEIDAEVPGIYLTDLKEDQVASIEVPHHAPVSGRVRRIGAEIDATTQMGHVRIGLEPTPLLRPGSFVRADVEARQSCGVSIPRAAILDSTDGTSVQVVRGHNLETRRVEVGIVSLMNAEIAQGLKVGDIVVAHAGTSLRDSDIVAPKFEEPSSDKDGKAR